jgi:hypothetical protein
MRCERRHRRWWYGPLLVLCAAAPLRADGLQTFGYFQNAFIEQSGFETPYFQQTRSNSFSVQQLNLFFQQDLDERWRAFVNFEFLNSFSSSRRWGSGNLEEAWVRYRWDARFSLKLGQSIPVFNNLNEVKNRTPVLPYAIRPLVYETSFEEFIPTEEFLPSRAYVQAYGFLPAGRAKVDYALFAGNGPNINDNPERGQTGVDTTSSLMLGGRLGLRVKEWKAGLSVARDHVNAGEPIETERGELSLQQITRRRFGADLSGLWKDWSLEAEWIAVDYDDDTPEVTFDKSFWYATLGYRASERWYVFASYWVVDNNFVEDINELDVGHEGVTPGSELIVVPTLGLTFNLRDQIILKGQFAPVDGESELPELGLSQEYEFNHISVALSVIF